MSLITASSILVVFTVLYRGFNQAEVQHANFIPIVGVGKRGAY